MQLQAGGEWDRLHWLRSAALGPSRVKGGQCASLHGHGPLTMRSLRAHLSEDVSGARSLHLFMKKDTFPGKSRGSAAGGCLTPIVPGKMEDID